jgi:Putative oxalocrotonate tautomerase enzyme
MPNYTISHQVNLNEEERTAIAQAITHVHASMFSIPGLFVSVTFQPTSQCISYSGGKRVSNITNTVTAYVRSVSRPREEYVELCHRIEEGWKNAIGPNAGKEKQLTSIFIQGTIVAGWEQGVMIPEPGHDRDWLTQQFADFQKRAQNGEEEMKELVEDIEKRGLI